MQQLLRFLTLIILCLPGFSQGFAQTGIPPNSIPVKGHHANTDSADEKDITDIFAKLLHRNTAAKEDSLRRLDKLHFSILPAVGYTLQTRLAAIVAGNLAFYNSAQSNEKISSVYFNVAYTQNKQFTVPVQSSIWTSNNKLNFVGDWRFMKYPQNTYGLGGNNSLSNASLIDYSYIRIYETVYRKLLGNWYIGAGYNFDYHFNIEEEEGANTDFKTYGDADKTVASGLSLSLLFDNRENSINPSNGIYGNVQYRNNITQLGSDNNWQSLIIDVRKYFPVQAHNVLAFWSYNWFILNGRPPYLLLPSTSWDTYTNTGRGYIQGRFRSNQMLYLEGEYRFRITNNGLLGGVIFANAQSFAEYPGNNFEYIQPAAGLGLRIKLNKISKTNVTIDYGFGKAGSRGLFINVGEVF